MTSGNHADRRGAVPVETSVGTRLVSMLLLLLDTVLGVSILIMPVVWLLDPLRIKFSIVSFCAHWGAKTIAIPVTILCLRGLLKRWSMPRLHAPAMGLWEKPGFKRMVLAAVVPFGMFLLFDLALAAAGFSVYMPPIVIKSGPANATVPEAGFVDDQELRWKFTPGATHLGLKINALGFADREVSLVKEPGTKRVICMGCSCTAQGPLPYSQLLELLLTNNPPTDCSWEAFNMGVFGYSSVQGLKLFQMKGRQLSPDFVTVYYGWNDHWRCNLRPDSNIMAMQATSWQARAQRLLLRKRVFQFLFHVMSPFSNAIMVNRGDAQDKALKDSPRVPPDEYRLTLRRYVAEIRAAGAIPILITAPRRAELPYLLVENGQAVTLEEVIKLHDQYAQITRDVAMECAAPLLDLEAVFPKSNNPRLLGDDGIHLTLTGRKRVASEIYDKIVEIAGGMRSGTVTNRPNNR